MTVRTRIAPSPTGFMHIGTLRTALWDYFLARQHKGQFIIRVEDTDQKRSVEGAVEGLLATMQKLGLEHDEGPVLQADGSLGSKGERGPYVQSQRLELYKPYVEQLLEAGHAYYCFCSAERLEQMRAEQTAVKQTPKYDRLCLRLGREEIAEKIAAGEPKVVRLKIPDGLSVFTDAIRGKISFNNNDVDDQVLVKTNGFPTYHLAVVVDDHLMEITHVLRGEEWLPSTPKQIILHSMLGWDMPVYAHVPLLLNPDKKKLSKRQGDVSVEDFLAKGYLPEALLNFVATLGFNPTSDREIFTQEELTAAFDLSKVNKAGAVLNVEKLNWMNQQYLQQLSEEQLFTSAKPFLGDLATNNRASRAVFVERSRVSRLNEFAPAIRPYVEQIAYEPSIIIWKKADQADSLAQLAGIREFLANLESSAFENISLLEESIKGYIANKGVGNGNVLWPLRIALSGLEKSASPFEFLWVLGKEESLARIDIAIHKLSA